MFDIGAMELLVIVIVAVIVIGPKDMPLAMRTAGRWIGKVRKVSSHFRTGIDAMVREAELEDMEKQWKARNDEIMRKHPPTPSQKPADTSANIQQGATAEAKLAPDDQLTEMTGPPASPEASAQPPSDPAPNPASAPAPDAPASDKS